MRTLIPGQNCENRTAIKPETKTKVDFLFDRANILSKRPVRKIGQKNKEKPSF